MASSVANLTPTFERRQLGVRLKRHRIAAGKTVRDVDESGVVSDSTLWRIESGLVAVKTGTVRDLCELYGVDPETTRSLVAFAAATKGAGGWFEAYGDAIPSRLELYFGAERAASVIQAYDTEAIVGALQTPEYAAALFRGELPEKSPEEIDLQIQVRMERQRQYWETRPPGARLCVVLGQAALAREVGGRGTMRRQNAHLRELSGHSGVDVRIMPWSAGGHPAIYGGFTIFTFPEPEDPGVVFTESYSGGQYLPLRDAGRILAAWDRVFALSIPIEEHSDGYQSSRG
jgi:transcriptional regulator with XRE-family HTH domain